MKILRNGRWVEIETGKAARQKVQAEKAAQIQTLEEELEQVRGWYVKALETFNRIECRILENHISSLQSRIAKLKGTSR